MADALYNAILGDEAPQAKSKSDVPSVVNPNNVGNLRPIGQSTGFQQFSSPEEGIKAMDNQLRIYGEKHKINTLRGVISRYAPPSDKNDTEGIIKFVADKTGLKPDQEINLSDPVIRHIISGPMIIQEKGYKNLYGQKTEANPSSNDPLYNAILNGEFAQPAQETKQTATQQLTEQKNKRQSFVESAAERSLHPNETVRGIGEAIASNVYNPLLSVVGGIKGVVQSIPEAIKTGQTPEPIGEKIATEFIEKHKFEPKTETGKAINQFISEIPEKITGSHMGVGPIPEAMGVLATPKEAVSLKGAKAKLSEQFEKQFPKGPERAVEAVKAEPSLAGVGAAKAEFNPYGVLTGEEKARGEYPQVKLSKTPKNVDVAEQKTRSQIASEILGPESGVRQGVITGNEDILRNEHTLAKSSNRTPEGELLKEQIAKEQNALSDYAKKRIENTGADQLLQNDYERGQRINDAFAGDEGATGFFKKAKDALYQDARSKVGNNPIASTNVDNLLGSAQFKAGAGLRGNEAVLKSAESLIKLAKEVGFEDEFGNKYAPNSIGGFDAVKKSLNADWTPSNASMIRKINNSIDKDIASAGGGDLLKKADTIHQAEKEFFGSKGIKNLFGKIDSNGVQTATAFEQIPKKLNSMPIDQWKNIYDIADKFSRESIEIKGQQLNIPPELRQAAQSAKNEMAGALAREVYEAGASKVGVWNQNDVNKVLNARSAKIKYAFTPEEQKAFHTLNYGGHLMPGVHAYEGAGLQAERVGKLANRLPGIGREIGAFTGVPFAATLGEKLGEKGKVALVNRKLAKQATTLEKKMKENAKLGTKISNIGKE
jgi:hypothetical protein